MCHLQKVVLKQVDLGVPFINIKNNSEPRLDPCEIP